LDALTTALAAERSLADGLAATLESAKIWYPGKELYPGWPEALHAYHRARGEGE